MEQREYRLSFFDRNNYIRRACVSCGTPFWSKGNNDKCADTPCTNYYFFDMELNTPKLNVKQSRELFINFFKRKGHTYISPRPVLARWREDLYLTIASIVVFQPHVTSGLVEPPANPLVISQPSIRLDDIDNVGVTFGRHLTTFEMAAHHAFNYPDKYVYWKDETVEYAKEFFTEEMKIPEEMLNFKESWWEGGGNAGPCFEVTVGGLELATLVFIQYRKNGDNYEPLPLKIVDTGYGVERIAWFSQRSPTAFHAIYGELVAKFFDKIGISPPNEEILRKASYYAGQIDTENPETLQRHFRMVAESLKLDTNQVRQELETSSRVFQVLDHTKTVAMMLGDGLVPSNTGEGYLGRLVIRRVLKVLRLLRSSVDLLDLIKTQIDYWKDDFPQLSKNRNYIIDAVSSEVEKFEEALSNVNSAISLLKREGGKSLIKIYDSFGIPPEILAEEASKRGMKVEIPRDFYARVAKIHGNAPLKSFQSEKLPREVIEDVRNLPKTELLYYTDPYLRTFFGKVIWSNGKYVVMDRTVFYPEGGGQLGDQGIIMDENNEYKVLDTQAVDGVVVHILESGTIKPGSTVKGTIDWERRYRLMRHHTTTHIVLAAAKKILGSHVWQAGAEKRPDKARLDITHFRMPTTEEIQSIEESANKIVLDRRDVTPLVINKNEAEAKYGFDIYEGGPQLRRDLRLIEVRDWDIEACGGTHVKNTSEIGGIKIVNVDKIQDGIIRLEYVAGDIVSKYALSLENRLNKIATLLNTSPSEVEERLTSYLKRTSENDRVLREYRTMFVRNLENTLRPEIINDKRLYIIPELPEESILQDIMRKITTNPKTLVVYFRESNNATRVEIACSSDLNVEAVIAELIRKFNGRGGGKGTKGQVVTNVAGKDKAIQEIKGILYRL
ncbi:alanine--tRNA ligase [Sulfolobales archaeon HS-7]|nr:alanine--tRNA ligase [Sulfolobales archaeon HS-7]